MLLYILLMLIHPNKIVLNWEEGLVHWDRAEIRLEVLLVSLVFGLVEVVILEVHRPFDVLYG